MQPNKIYLGNAVDVLKGFPDECADCCVCSPPYYGLRNYGTGRWEGGVNGCNHMGDGGNKCVQCGARYIDEQIGQEGTPEEYVENIVGVFGEVKRVLRKHGTLWLVIGDSYCTTAPKTKNVSQTKYSNYTSEEAKNQTAQFRHETPFGLKPKDLIGIPWRTAFALQGMAVVPMQKLSGWADMLKSARENQDWDMVMMVENVIRSMDLLSSLQDQGFYLRQDIIWSKKNSMPESVRDRCTKTHEYVFLLSKSKNYYFDHYAIREAAKEKSMERWSQDIENQQGSERRPSKTNGTVKAFGGPNSTLSVTDEKKVRGHEREHQGFVENWDNMTREQQMSFGANKKSVWVTATYPFKGAHFATYPRELIKPMLKAGLSDHGYCPHCHKPWVRILKRKSVAIRDEEAPTKYEDRSTAGRLAQLRQSTRQDGSEYVQEVKSVGWRPTCDCADNEPVPGIVIDPFMGSGTTAVEAVDQGHQFVGIELNPANIKMADERLKKMLGLWYKSVFVN